MRRRVIITSVAAILASLVVIGLALPPDAHVLLFDGGARDAMFGLSMVALVPLLAVVQIGLGIALANRLAVPGVAREPWLLWLSGSALLSLIGVAIAAASLVNPWVSGGVFVFGVAYAAATGACADALRRLSAWTRLEGIASNRPAFALVRLGIAAALVMIGLRAATGELNDTDVVQFYWGWLNEVRHLGGIHLSTELPLLDFAPGRGNGAYLLLAGMAPGLVSHAVSAGYCVMFAITLRAFLLRSAEAAPIRSNARMLLVADIACLATLWMLPGSVAFGKYHLQFAAWALGFLLVCIEVANESDDALAKAKRRLAMPLAIAIAVGLAQFEAFVVAVLGLAVASAPLKWRSAQRLAPLLIAGGVSAALSLGANWLYLGIPDYNPFALFERFIIDPRFSIWTSRLQQYYINYIQGGALSFKASDDVGMLRALRSLAGAIVFNLAPIATAIAGLLGIAIAASLPALRRPRYHFVPMLLGVVMGYALYRVSLRAAFYDLALGPAVNRLVLYALASGACLAAVRPFRDKAARPFVLGLLGYWLICAMFILVFHSGSMERLMRHSDVVFVGLLLLSLVHVVERISAVVVALPIGERARQFRLHRSAAAPLLLALGVAFSLHAAAAAWAVDPPRHLLASTLGLKGRAIGLTHPMARFERCDEIRRSVPADVRVLFLNAYTAMAYCNNAVLLPRTMVVAPHASDFARELATAAFADAETVEATLHRMGIDYFLVLKGDQEFWASGLSAPFRPGELERRFDLFDETPSFYVLTWHGAGRRIPADALARISEWRRITIQQHGFMAQNEFVGQWRAMAGLGADRPRYKLGSRLDFTAAGWSALYADHGWYAAEPEGTWTVGPVAVLTIPLQGASSSPLRVTMEVRPLVVPQLPNRIIHVKVGAAELATWSFERAEDFSPRSFDLPPEVAAGGEVVLTFEIENSVSQYALGLNADWRPLGMEVRSLVMESIAGAPR